MGDCHTIFFEGISKEESKYNKEELDRIGENYTNEQKEKYIKRQVAKYDRLSKNSLDEENKKKYKARKEEWQNRLKNLRKPSSENIQTQSKHSSEKVKIHKIGKLDKSMYSCITKNMVTDEVIITDERIKHIKERHPNDFEKYQGYIKRIIENPDFIVEANKPNTGVLLKEFTENDEKFKLILKIATSGDNKEYKNSVISFWKIGNRTFQKVLKKNILYKRQ